MGTISQVTRSSYQQTINSTYTDTASPGRTFVVAKNSADTLLCTGSDSKQGVTNPEWKRLIAKRVDASSGYKIVKQSCRVGLYRCKTLTKYGGQYYINADCSMRYLGPTPSSDYLKAYSTSVAAQDRALASYKRKLTSKAGTVKVLQPLIENSKDFQHTVMGAVDLTTSFLGTLADIKRTRGRSAFKYAAKAWLTYGFGIAPIIKDAADISAAIAEYLRRNSYVVRLTATGHDDCASPSDTYVGITGAYNAPVTCVRSMYHKRSYRLVGGHSFTAHAANDYDALVGYFNANIGMMIPTLWELMPFSWVIDYFTTVGSYLEDVFIATPGSLNFLVSTRKYTAQGTSRLFAKAGSGTTIVSESPATNTFEYFECERSVLSGLPMSHLRVLSLDEAGKYGITKLLNLMSVGMGFSKTPRRH